MILIFLLLCFLLLSPAQAVGNFPLDGTFLQMVYLPTSSTEISQKLDNLKNIGMTTLIFGALKSAKDGCQDIDWSLAQWGDDWSQNRQRNLDKLDLLFPLADQKGFQIYLGLMGAAWSCSEYWQNSYADKVYADLVPTVQLLVNRYGQHPSFAGWYAGDEPWLPSPPTYYFKKVRDAAASQSQKPILVSPYIISPNHPQYLNPNEFAAKLKTFLDSTGYDIALVQDGSGVANTPVFDSPHPQLQNFYQAIASQIGSNRLWSDNELFTHCAYSNCFQTTWDEYFSPTSLSRLSLQVQQSPSNYISRRVAYDYDLSLSHQKGTARLLDSYIAKYGQSLSKILSPTSYQFIGQQPDPRYPDSSNELFNQKIADPADFSHFQWVGIVGSAQIQIQLPSTKKINWVAVQTLNNNAAGIKLPSQLSIDCLNPQNQWTSIGSWNNWISRKDRVFVFSNENKITTNNLCSQLKLNLQNDSWTFLDEVEIIGEDYSVPPTNTPTRIPTLTPTRTPTPTIRPTNTPTATPSPIPCSLKSHGDADCNNLIDGLDYSIWRKEYIDICRGDPIKRSTWNADFNRDQFVDGIDYTIWRQNFLLTL